MFAIVLENYLACPMREKPVPFGSRFIDLGPLEFFECDGQQSEHDSEMLELIKDLITENTNSFDTIPNWYVDSLISVDNYRKFYAMIQRYVPAPLPSVDENTVLTFLFRNAQELHPISDLHLFLATCDDIHRLQMSKYLPTYSGKLEDLNEFLQEDELLQSLCTASATSMLRIGNCMNHSCSPNVIAACGHPDSRIQFVAIKPISKGEELFRSYIDESLPYTRRQHILQKEYDFKCNCTLCSTQK